MKLCVKFYNVSLQLRGIQQLRGPNLTQFRPPTLFEKTNMDILSTLCPVTHQGLFTDPHPLLFVHIVIE